MGVDEGAAEYFLSDQSEILFCDHDAAYCRNVAEDDDHISARGFRLVCEQAINVL